jgi:acyl carrier protein
LRAGYCAAFSVEVDDQDRLVIVQEVELRRRSVDTVAALQAIRRAVAARHEVEVYEIVLTKAGTIPKTSSGKTRRSACRERYLSGQLRIVARWQADPTELDDEGPDTPAEPCPRTVTANEVESWLAERVAARLRLPQAQVHATTPFLDFGMASIDAVEIAADLERWLGRRLSPTAIYNHPNIAALAQWIASPPTDLEPLRGARQKQSPFLESDPRRLFDEVQQMTEQQLEAFVQREMARQTRT